MKKIVLISKDGRVDSRLLALLRKLFPTCRLEVATAPAPAIHKPDSGKETRMAAAAKKWRGR